MQFLQQYFPKLHTKQLNPLTKKKKKSFVLKPRITISLKKPQCVKGKQYFSVQKIHNVQELQKKQQINIERQGTANSTNLIKQKLKESILIQAKSSFAAINLTSYLQRNNKKKYKKPIRVPIKYQNILKTSDSIPFLQGVSIKEPPGRKIEVRLPKLKKMSINRENIDSLRYYLKDYSDNRNKTMQQQEHFLSLTPW